MRIIQAVITAIKYVFKLLSALYFHKTVYSVVGFFATRKFKPAKKQHKYAILIAARNEEAVIGNLIESIRRQDYPAELITVFVVADNCTDGTAAAARELGAVCYERFDTEHRTKGFALQYLVKCIDRDFGVDSFEGYFIFDADNLLKSDFVSRMNDSFDAGEKIITSYRNTKNFGDNWISASYGIHWLRTVRAEHRARSLFGLATRIQGTGFLFASELIRDGWNYTSLTEDRAFSADAVVNGYRISYNHEAEFYDEQPIDMRTAMRQRIRWAKGHLQAFAETCKKLFLHIFVVDKKVKERESAAEKPSSGIALRFMSYDMLSIVFPYGFACFVRDVVIFILNLVLVMCSLDYFGAHLAPSALRDIFEFFKIDVTTDKLATAVLLFILFCLADFVIAWIEKAFVGAYVFFMERKRIAPISWHKKVWYCFMFPLFDLIGKISTAIALFKHVEWKPIRHGVSTNISEIEEALEKK